MSTNNTIMYNTENSAKYEIIEFLKVLRSNAPALKTNHLILINGGAVNGIHIDGFLKMKSKVLNLLKEPADNSSVALNYINVETNNLKGIVPNPPLPTPTNPLPQPPAP